MKQLCYRNCTICVIFICSLQLEILTLESKLHISHFLTEELRDIRDIVANKTDTHVYYNSTLVTDPIVGTSYWIDMESNRSNINVQSLATRRSHRAAKIVELSFEFPFYGHPVKKLAVTTGGFLNTGHISAILAASQYVAPLMANFDTSSSPDSYIRYVDNGTSFTVQWGKVCLNDKSEAGEFTFQTTLMNNGDIMFVYKTIPFPVQNINDTEHPVKVGLSDSYMIDRMIYFVQRKTLFEYHRLSFDMADIKNWTVIHLKALPTCLDSKDCRTCVNTKIPSFECTWCSEMNICSNGMDRHRGDWIKKGCLSNKIENEEQCLKSNLNQTELTKPSVNSPPANTAANAGVSKDTYNKSSHTNDQDAHTIDDTKIKENNSKQTNIKNNQVSEITSRNESKRLGTAGILTILLTIVAIAGLGVWILYARRNPYSPSGQILIRCYPSRWKWKREPHYMVAANDM